MKRKKRIIVVGVSLLAVGLVATAVVAGGQSQFVHRDPEKMKKFIHWRINDALDDLDATEDQREAILAATDQIIEDGMAMRSKRNEDRELVHQELEKDQPDPAVLHALIDAKFKEMRAFAHRSVDTALEAYSVLSPDQRAELMELVEEHHHHH